MPDADPRAQDLDAAVAAAFDSTAPSKPRAEAADVPDVDHEAPFGREDDGTPKAPYGHKPDGTVKRSAGGRKPKNDPDRARVGNQAPSGQVAKTTPAGPVDYTEGLLGAANGAWLCLSAAAKLPVRRVPLLGGFLPEDVNDKLAAQAFVFHQSQAQLAVALNVAAQHNARAAALARRLSEGDATWVLTVASLAGPFVSASLELWGGAKDEVRAKTVKNLAASNESALDDMRQQFAAMAEQIQAQAMAEMVPQGANGHQQPVPVA